MLFAVQLDNNWINQWKSVSSLALFFLVVLCESAQLAYPVIVRVVPPLL